MDICKKQSGVKEHRSNCPQKRHKGHRMTLSDIPILNAISSRLDFLTRKQRVISRNIANADTSEYKAREVKEPDFQKLLGANRSGGRMANAHELATTDANHMSGGGGLGGGSSSIEISDASEAGLNGNTVVLEEQVMDMASTQMEYGMFINLYRKHLELIRTAIGRN